MVARSLGLKAYRALTERGEAPEVALRPPRPEGELIWLHIAEAGKRVALLDLAARLISSRDGLSVLITQMDPGEAGALEERAMRVDDVPSEHPQIVAGFLDHWQPDACLWTWGKLRPNLVLEAAARGCPLILLDADASGFDGRRDWWMPDFTGQVLSCFSHVLVRSAAGLKRLRQSGLPQDRAQLTPPLVAGGRALGCAESDLTELSAALAGRPAWFAVDVQPMELPTVIAAHRQALRLSHRLLLILTPTDPRQAETARQQAAEAGLSCLLWGDGADPDETTQVMITDDLSDRGLFYRLAPVSFLGSSLVSQGTGRDPFEAAALGSAVLYGPRIGGYLPAYSRLAAAGAARIVNDAPALGTAVSRLIAPDQAATMAHAGWDVISQGAELTDQITELVQETLDAQVRAR